MASRKSVLKIARSNHDCSVKGFRLLPFNASLLSLLQEGMTSLHVSAERPAGDEILYALLCSSCDVNVPNKLGRTALHLAAKVGNLGHLKALLDAGCDRNIKDKLGYTAVGVAFKFNQKASVDVLLHYKPRGNRRCNTKCSLGAQRPKENTTVKPLPHKCFIADKKSIGFSCSERQNVELPTRKEECYRIGGLIPISSDSHFQDLYMNNLGCAQSRDFSAKTVLLLVALLKEIRNTLDGLKKSSAKNQLVRSIMERDAFCPMLASLSSIKLPLLNLPTAAWDDKQNFPCVRGSKDAFDGSGPTFPTSPLIKLLCNLKHSLGYSKSNASFFLRHIPCCFAQSSWQQTRQHSSLGDLERFGKMFRTFCKEMNDPKVLKKMLDIAFAGIFADDIFDSAALARCVVKYSGLMRTTDSKAHKENSDHRDASLDVAGSCLFALEHVVSSSYSSIPFAEEMLKHLLREPHVLRDCYGKESPLLRIILSKIIVYKSSCTADKVAKIFLQVCVAFAGHQRLLHHYAIAVIRHGLLHSKCDAISLGTRILIRMGLLKGERKVEVVENLEAPIVALSRVYAEEYFPRELAAVFVSFLCKPSSRLYRLDKLRLQALASALTKEVLPTSTDEAESSVGKGFKRICDIAAIETDPELFYKCTDTLFSHVFFTLNCRPWSVGENLLVYMGLLKGECHIETVRDLRMALRILNHILKQNYFPSSLKDMFVLFLQRQRSDLNLCSEEVNKVLSTLKKISTG